MSLTTHSGILEVDSLLGDPEQRWNALRPYGSAATVTYSFFSAAPPNYQGSVDGFQAFSEAWKAETRAALQAFSAVANITFVELADPSAGQIRFAFNSQSDSAGYAYLPSVDSYWGVSDLGGDVWINNEYVGESPVRFLDTLLHEIGHAVGLKHPGNYSGSEERPFLPAAEDNTTYTVMSYNNTGGPDGLGPLDVQALEFLYGPKTAKSVGVMTWAGDGNDTLAGDANANHYHGNGGADLLSLAGGDDRATGGTGSDTLDGGDGNDLIYGNQDGDLLQGDAGADTLYGGQGVDILTAGAGADVAYGNLANDALWGGAAGDTLFGGLADDDLHGDDGDDLLFGNRDADTLFGGAGADTLYGGFGDDRLQGDAGADTYIFVETGFGQDVVSGFEVGQDRIAFGSALAGVVNARSFAQHLVAGTGGTLLDLGGAGSVLFLGVGVGDLSRATVWDVSWA